MNQRTWIIVAVALVLCNIGLVAFLIFDKAKPHHEGPRNHIIEVLHFDKKQVEQYDALIAQHRREVQSQEQYLMKAKSDLFASVLSEPGDSVVLGLEDEVNKVERKMLEIHLAHFKNIKSICKPEQLPAFEALMGEVGHLFSPAPKRH